MQRGRLRLTSMVTASAGVVVLLSGPAQAATTTVTGDFNGTVRTLTATSIALDVTSASKALRLLSGRTVKVIVDAKSIIKREGLSVKPGALQSTDSIAARVKCTFTLTSSSTKISCRAIRITATPYVPPAPIKFSITATISAIQGDALTMVNPLFTADAAAAPVVDPLRASSPIGMHIPSSAQVFLGTDLAAFSAFSVGQKVTISVTCAPAEPYNCKATRVDIPVAAPQSVALVGILTLTTKNSITIDVESVVGRSDSSVNVQVLKRKQMLISVPAATPVTIAGSTSAFSTGPSLVIGVRYVVTAVCRVDVPFNCVADAIKG